MNSVAKQQLEIRCDDDGLSVIAGGPSQPHALLKWQEVTTVLACKRDVYAFDLICLAFSFSAGTIEVDEQMEGWSQLVEALPSHLPGALKFLDWYERVVQPPFATCATTVFERAYSDRTH